jgi:hypothetical protein
VRRARKSIPDDPLVPKSAARPPITLAAETPDSPAAVGPSAVVDPGRMARPAPTTTAPTLAVLPGAATRLACAVAITIG